MTRHSFIAFFASLKKKPKTLTVIVVSVVALAAFSLAFPKIKGMYRSTQLKENKQRYSEQALFIREIKRRIPQGMDLSEAQERFEQKYFKEVQCRQQPKDGMETACYDSSISPVQWWSEDPTWGVTIQYKDDKIESVIVTQHMGASICFT